jgi:hypothetical protein
MLFDQLRRREFIRLLAVQRHGGSRCAMPVVGFLGTTSMAATPSLVAAFRQGLKENAYAEGQNWVKQASSA